MTGKKYTKAEIVDSVHNKTGIERNSVRIVTDAVLDDIKAALADGRVIELRGFGTFEIKIRKGRQQARNPRTGEMVSVNSHGIAHFRAGQELKQDCWNLKQEEKQ